MFVNTNHTVLLTPLGPFEEENRQSRSLEDEFGRADASDATPNRGLL